MDRRDDSNGPGDNYGLVVPTELGNEGEEAGR